VGFQVIPREQAFYGLFSQAAAGVAAGARELSGLIDALPNGADHARRIRDLEHEGDTLTHRIMETLNTTFLTPFDRQDIHRLASSLDDVLDLMEAVADLLVLHRVEAPLAGVRLQADVLSRITMAVEASVGHLRTFAHVDRDWADINRLEREGDRIYRRAVADLFSEEYPAIEVLKWKDIIDQMEAAIDHCHTISNTIGSIAMKFA
jgi:predicted phosphate transport protein (TIGR00153 family)